MNKKLLWLCFLLVLVGGCKNQSKEELLQEGVELSRQGNFNGAVVLYKNALDKDPNYSEARFQLGIAYLETDKYEKAEKEFRKVQLQDPANVEVLLRLADVQNATGRPDDAIDGAKRYIELGNKSSKAFESLGRSYAIKEHWGQAEKHFREALVLDPANSSARLDLSRVFFFSQRLSEARTLIEETIGQAPRLKGAYFLLARIEASQGNREAALGHYRKIIEIDPADIGAIYLAGLFALDSGDLQTVDALAMDLLSKFPDHPAGNRLIGMSLYLKGDYENALVELRNSLKTMPDLIGFYFTGLAEYKIEQYEQALNQFQKALDLQPSHAQSRLMVAMTLLKQQRLDDCIAEVTKSLQYDARNGLAYNILGSAYLAKGNFDLAMSSLDKAIEIDPSLADAHLKKGLFNLSTGAPEQAETELVKALAAAPEVLNTRLLLAALYLRQENYSGAVQVLTGGLAGTPADALVYNYLAASYFAQKKIDLAVEALQKAKQVKPDYAAPYFNLASYYLSTSARDKAVDEYRSLLAVDPKNLRALLSLATLYEVMEDGRNAAATYERARQTEEPGGYLAYAAFLSRNSTLEEAQQVLEAAFAAHPENPEILESWGKVLLSRGDIPGADNVFEALEKVKPGGGLPLKVAARLQQGNVADALSMAEGQIAARPDSVIGYSLLALIHERQGELVRAEAALKRGVSVVADPLPLNMRLGSFYLGHDKSDQALRIFDEVLKKNPHHVPALFAVASTYDSLGNKRKAVDLYREILEKDQGYTPALNNLAYLYADNYGSYEESLALAMKAFRNEPTNPGIMDTLGYSLLKNGRTDEALKTLDQAASMLPKVPAVRLHLAQAQMATGRLAEATESLELVVGMGAGAEQDRARQLLKEMKK